MKMLVGLGNPGSKYDNTRHNVGFMVLDALLEKWQREYHFSAWQDERKFQGLIATGFINNEKIFLLKPQTYMNESGHSVQALANYYKIDANDIIIIHDDLDITFGELKKQFDRSSAGHKGIQSITALLSTQAFHRLRIGIAKKDRSKQGNTARFVLRKFTFFEQRKLKNILQSAINTLEIFVN